MRETLTIDRQGNMTVTREWLEGNADQSLPDAVHNQYKHLMPSHGAGHEPVVRSVYANGVLRYYTKRGRVARETRVDAGAFRVPVAALDSMKARSRRNENAQTRSAEILRGLAERDGRWEEVARTVVERHNIELIVN